MELDSGEYKKAYSVTGSDMGIRMPRGSGATFGHLFYLLSVRTGLQQVCFSGTDLLIEREMNHEIR